MESGDFVTLDGEIFREMCIFCTYVSLIKGPGHLTVKYGLGNGHETVTMVINNNGHQ